jgi:hypothetical protein
MVDAGLSPGFICPGILLIIEQQFKSLKFGAVAKFRLGPLIIFYIPNIRKCDMAILGIFSGDGFTKQKYDELRKEVGWDQNPPTGVLLHSAGLDNSGNIHVADVWESEQDLNNFINSRLKPVMEKINLPMPKGEIFPIHNLSAFSAIDRHKIK